MEKVKPKNRPTIVNRFGFPAEGSKFQLQTLAG